MFDSFIDPALRLAAAVIAGMAIGLNRDLHGKPTGIRTLGLVGLGAALVTYGALHAATNGGSVYDNLDASSRAVQGLIQGLLTGIGFIGAGVILHDTSTLKVHGLTTAAAVWVTAAIGLIAASANGTSWRSPDAWSSGFCCSVGRWNATSIVCSAATVTSRPIPPGLTLPVLDAGSL